MTGLSAAKVNNTKASVGLLVRPVSQLGGERPPRNNPRLSFLPLAQFAERFENGELYGFERLPSLTKDSAQEIAEAAKQFGQEDDITVLTLALATS
jgi:hypothetical protein